MVVQTNYQTASTHSCLQSCTDILMHANMRQGEFGSSKLITTSTTSCGTISIKDLEMAGVLLGWWFLTLEYFLPDMRHHQDGIQCDNSSPTVHWSRKFTARSPVAGHLLQALLLCQQIHQSALLLVIPMAGEDNTTMADVASRFATDASMHFKCLDLLTYFNTFFSQEISWKQF